MDAPILLAVFSGCDRVEMAERIRSLVAILFDVGTTEAGELALAWMMMLAAPERPSSVQHVVPQLAFILERSLLSDSAKADLKKRLDVWWDAAAGKYQSRAISLFQIAERVLNGGFEAARKAAMKEMAEADMEEIEAQRGPTLVVMPKAKSTRLDGGHSVHGAFKQLVDAKLPLIVARDVQAIRRKLHAEYPHATVAVDLLLRDLREDKPVTLKPVLLVGGPGAGKSRLVRRLGELLRLYVYRFDGASSHDGMFGGMSKGWSSSQPSAPARAVEQAKHANPIVMIDEIDKAAQDSSRNGSLANSLLPFLDPETARRFRDPSLDAELDLSRVTVIATANDDTHLPAPLKDRFRIIRVPDPTLAHLPALAANVMRELAASDEARTHDEPLADDELEVIGRAWKRSGMSMRKLQKIVGATLEARDAFRMRH
jgi:adenylate kinase family enzyme